MLTSRICVFFMMLLAVPAYTLLPTAAQSERSSSAWYLDTIHDSYREDRTFALHSQGILSYGAHTNTFHLRYAYLRANLEMNSVQFFLTLNGYRDTHNPDTNYSYILNNINLYDYGVHYRFNPYADLVLSGAAVLRKNTHNLLLLPALYRTGNPGEFDSPAAYIPVFLNAAGIRINGHIGRISLSYSQGDFRHSIPIAASLLYQAQHGYIRGLVQLENTDPLVYALNLYRADYQISSGWLYHLGQVQLKTIAEWTYSERLLKHWIRLEQSALWNNWGLALRFLYRLDLSPLLEASLSYEFLAMTRLGIQVSSDGRIYAASLIDF